MTYTNSDIEELEKLVNDIPLTSLDMLAPKPRLTKRQPRKRAEAHIRAHMSKGREYYYYIRGTDKEIYLGNADSILEVVKGRTRRK